MVADHQASAGQHQRPDQFGSCRLGGLFGDHSVELLACFDEAAHVARNWRSK
jgi:hypothetical protein